ncbi:MAG: TlpA disulfide reductase family protein [Flavobacteriaceae bacterium]
MSRIAIIIITALLMGGCKDSGSTTEMGSGDYAPPTGFSERIPIYDFDKLESKYLKINSSETYIINFWATWCQPCVKELPAFEKLYSQYQNQGVHLVLVSLDFPDKLETGVIPFVEKHDLKGEVVLLDDPDANTWIPKVSESWSGAIPATILLKNGTRQFYEQSFTYESLEKEVQNLLKR